MSLAPDRNRHAVQDVLEGIAGHAADDQLRLAQQALAQIRESVVITDTALEIPGPFIIYVNAAFTKMTGWLPNEVVGKNPRILQGPKTTRKTLDRLRYCLTNGRSFEGEDINYRKDGSEFWIDWYIEPLRGPDGAINYWVAVQRDVTEKRELMAQLLQAQRLEGIGLLASGIAHDLNNVLTPVLMGCEYLREHVSSDDARAFIQLVEDSARRGSGLVRQILSFGRGLTGKASLIEPRHIIDEVATMAQATFPKSIEIVAYAPASLWSVEADVSQLHQVVLNLCINARDAIGNSGCITLRGENVTLEKPLATARGTLAPGNYLCLSVADNGSGISPEIARRIFEPFFSTKAPGRGTGLGLSTVATIVANLGGGICLQTAPDEGTTFRVYFPASISTNELASSDRATYRGDGTGRLVMLADDETAIATIMREVLQAAGYRTQTASSGLEMLAAVETARPDLAVFDFMMPGVTGPELIREMRARYPHLPLVVISGRSADEIRAEAPAVSAILEKPFTPEHLLGALREVVRQELPP